jgi:hypothetical protein
MSKEERVFIVEQAGKLSAEEIAKAIDRTVEMVKEFIKEHLGADAEKAAPVEIALRRDLRSSAEWTELHRQFTSAELKYFEERYTTWLSQFKDNVLPSEETQIFMLLKNEILINRNLADKQRATSDMARMQTMLDDIYARYSAGVEMSDADKQLAADLNEQLTASRAAMSVRTSEYIKLQEKHSDLMKQLKATRDQRMKHIESSKESFIEILKELLHEEKRTKEGEHMELMRMAAEKEKGRMATLHTYADGGVDRPFLNADTVELEDNEEDASA